MVKGGWDMIEMVKGEGDKHDRDGEGRGRHDRDDGGDGEGSSALLRRFSLAWTVPAAGLQGNGAIIYSLGGSMSCWVRGGAGPGEERQENQD